MKDKGLPKGVEPGRLRISRLTVRGVLGIEESTIDLDTITVLSGANASAKSSHLAALRAALGVDRTSLARLAKVGSEAPAVEVILVGEDQAGEEREVHVTRKGDESPEVRERVGEDWRKVPRPVEWLRQLIDVQGADPAAWVLMKDEDKAAALLEAMPLPGYNREDALTAAGLQDFRLPAIPAGLHPLEDLEQVEAAVFSSRTEVNRQERAERDAADKLLAGLPAEPPENIAAAVGKLEADTDALASEVSRTEQAAEAEHQRAVAAANASLQLEEEKIRGSFQTDAAKLRADHDRRAAEIRADAERRIAEIRAEAERQVAADKSLSDAAVDALREGGQTILDDEEVRRGAAIAEADRTRQEALAAVEGRKRELSAAREKLAELRATQRSIETDKHVRATAQEAKDKARHLEQKSNELTRGLEELKRYKLRLAGSLPIKGLAVVFDDNGRKSLTLDGVPLSQVNRGKLAEVAVEVSLLRGSQPTGDRPYLPLVLLDDAEKLDPEARTALLREVASRGSQVVAAVVSKTALKVLRGEDALAGTVA